MQGLSPCRARYRSPSGRGAAVLNRGRSLLDHALAGEPAAAVVGPVALAALLHGAAQVPVQLAALAQVAPDVAVDGLVADGERPARAQVPGDLLRAPAPPQQPPDPLQLPGPEARMAARTTAPATCAFDRLLDLVAPIRRVRVAPHFAPDRAAVPAQDARDLRIAESLPSQGREPISLLGSDLVVGHGTFPFLGGNENLRLCQIASFHREAVALSL